MVAKNGRQTGSQIALNGYNSLISLPQSCNFGVYTHVLGGQRTHFDQNKSIEIIR